MPKQVDHAMRPDLLSSWIVVPRHSEGLYAPWPRCMVGGLSIQKRFGVLAGVCKSYMVWFRRCFVYTILIDLVLWVESGQPCQSTRIAWSSDRSDYDKSIGLQGWESEIGHLTAPACIHIERLFVETEEMEAIQLKRSWVGQMVRQARPSMFSS